MYNSKKFHENYKDNMKTAVEKVVAGQLKLRPAAEAYCVSKSTLHRNVLKYKNVNEEERLQISFERRHGFCQIFDDVE